MLPKAGKPIKENRRQMVIRNVPMEGQAVQGLAAGVMLPLPHTVMASNLPETVVLTLEQAKAIRHGISVNRNLNRMPGVHPVITVVAEKQPRKDQQDMLKDQEKMDQAILVMILINNPKEERDMVEPAVLADAMKHRAGLMDQEKEETVVTVLLLSVIGRMKNCS